MERLGRLQARCTFDPAEDAENSRTRLQTRAIYKSQITRITAANFQTWLSDKVSLI